MKIIPLHPDSQIEEIKESKQIERNQKNRIIKIYPMKNLLITITALAMTFALHSQSVYTLNGKLGIGKLPTEKLDVDGNAIIRGDLFVLGNTTLQLSTVVGQNLYLPNLSPITSGDIIVRGGDGKIRTMNPKSFHSLIQPTHTACNSSLNSYWKQQPGILYTVCDETKVGIGTSTPQHRLDVDGDGHFTSNIVVGNSPEDNGYKLAINTSSSGIYVNQNTTDVKNSITVKNNSEDRFKVFSNGVVSTQLGSDAWNALEIKDAQGENIFRVNTEGNLACTRITVLTSNFPDYVFEKDYKLMTLMELEDYITRNKHLPNVPSSSEVQKNGADLGEINRVLVEKVEEQTLYLIQHEKTISSQEQRIIALEKALEMLMNKERAAKSPSKVQK